MDLGRAAVLGALAGFVATGSVNLAVIYVAMFLIGTAETFADNAAQAPLATNVPRPEFGRANARLFGTVVVTNQLAGPPLGALLFGVGMAVPFGVNALCFVLGAALISRIRPPATEPERPNAALRREVVEGLRWLWANKPVRTLALTITAFNVRFGSVGALALGTLLGGVIAQQWGITAPFWFAFAGSAVITVVMWLSFANIVHEEPAAEDAHG